MLMSAVFIPVFPSQKIHSNPKGALWKPQSFPDSPHVNLSSCHPTAASASSWTDRSKNCCWVMGNIWSLSRLDRPFFWVAPPTITHEKKKRLKPGIKDSLQEESCSLWCEFTEYWQFDLFPNRSYPCLCLVIECSLMALMSQGRGKSVWWRMGE